MGRIGFNKGACEPGPLRTRFRPDGQPREIEDEVVLWNPRMRCDFFDDFLGAFPRVTFEVPLFASTGNSNALATTGTATGVIVIPRAGYLTSLQFVSSSTLAADDTNYVSFSLINKLQSGSGTAEAVVQDVTTTTSLTGGLGALTADKPLVVPFANLAAGFIVNEGDTVQVRATANGTLAGGLTNPTVRLTFLQVPLGWKPRAARTAGFPQVIPLNINTQANGAVQLLLDATSEIQFAGLDWGDNVPIRMTKCPLFQACVTVPTAIAAAQRVVLGLGGAQDGSLTDTSKKNPNFTSSIGTSACLFTLDANMNLAITADTVGGAQYKIATGRTLVAGTSYTLTIDCQDGGNIAFYLDQDLIVKLSVTTTGTLQPIFAVQKDSGTGVPSLIIDSVRVNWNRI